MSDKVKAIIAIILLAMLFASPVVCVRTVRTRPGIVVVREGKTEGFAP